MASISSHRSSSEADYREIYEATVHDRLRDGLEAAARRKKPKWGEHQVHTRQQDTELTRIATTVSKDMGIQPRTLAEIDPRLDPQNEAFDFRFWASTFVKLVREDGVKGASVGVTFKSLTVVGMGSSLALQPTVASPFKALIRLPMILMNRKRDAAKIILNNFHGSINNGEMLIVLGRPGSGCTSFLKAISGRLEGLHKSADSIISYDGVPQDVFIKNFRGRAVYNQENDEHFPFLTVGQTLRFAASSTTPQTRLEGVDRERHANHMVEVMLRIFGLSHARNTRVGNDAVRGVSGGERKRVSIAEMALARSSIAVWDNSTRGLDSATALEFVRSLRTLADVAGVTQAVAPYQASQSIYDLFDKVIVLYEGRQVFFGPVDAARSYFERMGWYCPPRQTTPDFLTSISNPSERRALPDHADQIPKTAAQFEQYWLNSEEYRACMAELAQKEQEVQREDRLRLLRSAHAQGQAHHTRQKSPYLLSVWMQLRLCMRRSAQLMWNDRGSTITLAMGRVILALIIGSIYYGPPDTTASLQSRGSVIFLATLMNALMAVTEIGALFAKRGIIQKQNNFAFYHPFADALASYVVDIPVKFVISTLFNVVYYFLAGLRIEASAFFVFLLFNFIGTLMMSAIFRSIGAGSKQLALAYAIAGIGILIMIIYTGFTLQTAYMHPWFRWIGYINPIAYVFEALLVNEVHGQEYPCAPGNIIPPYAPENSNFACAVIGAQPDQRTVSGDSWVQSGYGYSYSHIWRNLGIAFAYTIFFLVYYLLATEYKSTSDTQPERLIFLNPKAAQGLKAADRDVESKEVKKSEVLIVEPHTLSEKTTEDTVDIKTTEATNQEIASQSSTSGTGRNGGLTWQDLTLDITIQGNPRRLLDNVDGWVKPGTLTCLMGVSGAGKTTLLDTLAQRHNTVGKLSGNVMVNGEALKASFQRKTGYVQQQDLHLETTTVREALRFSALLRQPGSVPHEEKFAYVEKVIEMLNMETFSEAVVGRPGEGLNIEQRKLLTIGVELAAKPTILFLDEPTSGLDSQSSWTIVSLLRRLADNGQAILATIHQPSAMLFEQFDSILLLAKGGRTTYFGPLGTDAKTLTTYFETRGARTCGGDENPAEYILSVIADQTRDWPNAWKTSGEYAAARDALASMAAAQAQSASPAKDDKSDDGREFASSFPTQFQLVLRRLSQNYWRNPAYIYAKVQFALLSSLFIGFTFFLQNSSSTGMQNTVFAIYMLNATFSTVANQIMSRFIPQRELFEVRESPSKMYSWNVFLLANILIEVPYQIFLSVIVWACWYFPVFGLGQGAGSRAMMFAFCVQFLLFASTWAQMLIFTMPSTETAGALSTILFTLTLQFNGVLQPPSALPGFWIFLYRCSPFTYLIGGWAGTGLANRPVICAQNELAIFNPPSGQTCGTYLERYLEAGAPGALLNPSATTACEYCPIRNADQFLAASWITPSDQYRNLGIMFAYLAFNVFAAVGLYYVFRVRRFSIKSLRKPKTEKPPTEKKQQQPEKHDEEVHGEQEDAHEASQPQPAGKAKFYLGLYYHLALAVFKNTVR